MKLKHSDGWNIPASDPFCPDLPAVYRNVQMQLVFFEAAPKWSKFTPPLTAFEAHDPSIPACDPQRPRRWADPRLNLAPRASGYGGGQSGAGPLGGRSIGGTQQQPHRYAGGAALAVCDADLGPGSGDGGPQTLHAGDRHRCLLLRSQEPLATRIEREYEWVVAAVLPQKKPLYPYTHKSISTRSLGSSTDGPVRH